MARRYGGIVYIQFWQIPTYTVQFGSLVTLETDLIKNKSKFQWIVDDNESDEAQNIIKLDALPPEYIPPPPEPKIEYYTINELKQEATNAVTLQQIKDLLAKYADALGDRIPKP